MVQPDLVIVCDPSKLDDRGCRGAPDLVVEILSPSSVVRDMQIKKNLYERHGVREYWVVQPEERLVVAYAFTDDRFDRGTVYTAEDTPSLRILPAVQVPLADVFAE